MKIRKYILVLLSIFAIALLPLQAFAAGEIDVEQDAEMTVVYRDDTKALVGVQFDIYRIASVDKRGRLKTVAPFRNYHLNISTENESDWKTLATTLEGYVLRDGITPTASAATDQYGMADFIKIEQGLYLVRGHQHSQNGYIYETQPIVIQIPSLNAETDEWLYDILINAKADARPETEEHITRKVLKVWEDNGYKSKRPKNVVIDLLRDGEVYDTVTLNVENYWRHTWAYLDANHHWSVVERELEDYTVEVTREGVTFVVTNTYDAPSTTTPPPTTPPDEPKLPQTGQVWWPVPVLMAAGLLLIVIGLVRRRGAYDEE